MERGGADGAPAEAGTTSSACRLLCPACRVQVAGQVEARAAQLGVGAARAVFGDYAAGRPLADQSSMPPVIV